MTNERKEGEDSDPGHLLANPSKVWLPVGVTASLVLAVAGGSVWLNARLLSIEFMTQGTMTSTERVEAKVDSFEKRFDAFDRRVSSIEQSLKQDSLRTQIESWIEIQRARDVDVPPLPGGRR